jgi:acyl carrier protein
VNIISADEIEHRVKTIISNVVKVNRSVLYSEFRFTEELGMDSLDKASLFLALENEFGGSISEEDASTLASVGDIEIFIRKRFFQNNFF